MMAKWFGVCDDDEGIGVFSQKLALLSVRPLEVDNTRDTHAKITSGPVPQPRRPLGLKTATVPNL